MDVAFMLAAVRRYFWVVVLCAAVGALPAVQRELSAGDDYQATAVLEVRPPTGGNSNALGVDPDRYVISQLNVLESEALAIAVSEELRRERGLQRSASDLLAAVRIEQVPQTNNVEITTTDRSADNAAAISETYASLYVASQPTVDLDEAQRAALEQDVARLEAELDTINAELQSAMAPFLPEEDEVPQVALPTPDMVDPALASQRELVQAELAQVKGALIAQELSSRVTVNTAIVGPASMPLTPVADRTGLVGFIGIAAGLLIGVSAAIILARMSDRVLDRAAVEEIVGSAAIGELKFARSLAKDPTEAIDRLPESLGPTLDGICLAADAAAPVVGTHKIAIAGAHDPAGATTLALAVAGRYASSGAAVLLVDADFDDPRLTTLFGPGRPGSTPERLSQPDGQNGDDRVGPSNVVGSLTPTRVERLDVLAVEGDVHSGVRPSEALDLVSSLDGAADVVVIDCGPVRGGDASARVATLADVVVLAVPRHRQDSSALRNVVHYLDRHANVVLPVITNPSGGGRPAPSGGARSRSAASHRVEAPSIDIGRSSDA